MTRGHIAIDGVVLTGPEGRRAAVTFGSGLNIVWGASNSGKSFVRRAIDYVLGGESITLPEEGVGYDNVLLWLTLPTSERITLRRSVLGRDIYKAEGHLEGVDTRSPGYESLRPNHASNAPNVSRWFLERAGFRSDLKLLKNERAEKSSFSLRTLIHYLVVDETRMIDAKSVLLPHHRSTVTAEDRSLIRLLLTGVDGSSVEQVRTPKEMKASRDGKVSLLAEMANEVRSKIDETRSADDLERLIGAAEARSASLSEVLDERRRLLSALDAELAAAEEEVRGAERRAADLKAMLARFDELAKVYASDLERLRGLEEGGFLVQTFAAVNCPVCGSAREHFAHDSELSHVEAQRTAVAAEIAKIEADAADLGQSVAEATEEAAALEAAIVELRENARDVRTRRAEAGTGEANVRQSLLLESRRVEELKGQTALRERLERLEERRAILEAETIKGRSRAQGIDDALDLTGPESHGLSRTIRAVLKEWNYPGGDAVHYVPKFGDIQVDGKDRRDNGAGVRAVLHAAFKVALMLHCQEKGRPHPGFLVLDSPLMAFTETAEDPGEEERALLEASLATNFYRHLESLAERAQIIVIENHKDSPDIPQPFPNIRFTGKAGLGRVGFFENST